MFAKKAVRDAALAAGWQAQVESRDPVAGWRADVLVWRGRLRVAFEVQWSTQTVEEFERRTAQYAASGVQPVWLVRHTARGFWPVQRAVHALPYQPDGAVGWRSRSFELSDVVAAALAALEEGLIDADAPRLRRTSCYRCGHDLVFRDGRLFGAKEPFTEAQRRWLRGSAAVLKRAYSRTAGAEYPAWHCPSCGAMHGDFPLIGRSWPVTVHRGQLVDDTRDRSFWDVVRARLAPDDE